jgi:hypothetical protein
MKIYNALPKGLKSPLMHIAYGLQVLDGLLEHIASAFESLDLTFEAFDRGYIIICAFSDQLMSSAKLSRNSNEHTQLCLRISAFPRGFVRLFF